MPDKYDHLLPPERPRGYKPPRPTDLDCYGDTTAGVGEAIGEVWKGLLWLRDRLTRRKDTFNIGDIVVNPSPGTAREVMEYIRHRRATRG